MRTKGAWISVVACAVLVTAGCGDNTDAKAISGTPQPSTPRDQLVLTAAEFPAGTKALDLPPEKLRSSVTDLGDIMANSTVTPPECRGPQIDLAALTNDLLGDSAIAAAATDDMDVYIEFVSGKTLDLTLMMDTNAKCAHLTSTSTVDGKQVDTTVDMEKLPALAGVDSVAYKATSTSVLPDTAPMTRTAFQGWATLRGLTVTARSAALSGAPDQAAFEKFFTDAVEKVRKAK
ncbi:hypothetical protein OHB26_20835 [Nocardia sp. NBC_01503]|uniref:hypothetical protein n=1 Tax=Nocardia sp. NBC_01503 TaxID=2975997 RepID=UPI002E7BE3FD|nr:hypothetical protein [Nocardia sp. NBC_01503]WTL29448.1 hypothetical protein OHB26_20835 [Nocardia sp. NBC_01503]